LRSHSSLFFFSPRGPIGPLDRSLSRSLFDFFRSDNPPYSGQVRFVSRGFVLFLRPSPTVSTSVFLFPALTIGRSRLGDGLGYSPSIPWTQEGVVPVRRPRFVGRGDAPFWLPLVGSPFAFDNFSQPLSQIFLLLPPPTPCLRSFDLFRALLGPRRCITQFFWGGWVFLGAGPFRSPLLA